MTYIFRSKPEQTMAAFMSSIVDIEGDSLGARAEFRATMAQLVGLHCAESRHGAVDPSLMAQFREQSMQAMLAMSDEVSFLLNEAMIQADDCDEHQWSGLCLERSVIQFLLDDYANTPIPALFDPNELTKLDTRMKRVGYRYGPLEAHEIPRGMPDSHWWWYFPPP
jgi:hypothetical protein